MKKWFPFLAILLLCIAGFSLWPKEKKGVIVVDAGHGGTDPGTTSITGVHEKEIALQFALKIADALRNANYEVYLTRTEDVTLSLNERVQFANSKPIDLFLSIHGNALENNDTVEGLQVLYYPDEAERNVELATMMMNYLSSALQAPDRGVLPRPELAVLRGTTSASLLLETGFLSHPEEAIKLENANYQQQFSEAVVQAVDHILENIKQTTQE